MQKITGCNNCPFCLIRLQGFHETYSAAICIHPKYHKIVRRGIDDFNDSPSEHEDGKFIASEIEEGFIETPRFCPFKKYF